MILLLPFFPWLAAIMMQKPYGYMFAVDMWYGICGFLMIPVVLAVWVVDANDRDLQWTATGLMAYFWLMNWIL